MIFEFLSLYELHKCPEALIPKGLRALVSRLVLFLYSHSLQLALYGVNLGLFARFIGGFDRLFLLRLWSLRKNGIKMVSTNYL